MYKTKTRIEEANLSQSMEFTYDYFIKKYDKEEKLAYRPTSQKEKDWLKDNPTTGIIYLKKHPNVKEAWVLVKFESREGEKGMTTVFQNNLTLRSKEDFVAFFGVEPITNTFDDNKDMIVMVKYDKQSLVNKNFKRDFDETTPNFYMYVNHLKTSVDVLVKRLYKLDEIIDASGGTIGNLYNIPYSATNAKL